MTSGGNGIRWPSRISWPRSTRLFTGPGTAGVPPTSASIRGYSFILRPLSLTLDQILCLVCVTLLGIGLTMVQSADARVGPLSNFWLLDFFFNGSCVHVVLAIVLMCLMWRIDYRKLMGRTLLGSFAFWFTLFSIFLLGLVFTHLGASINGARRWLIIRAGSHSLTFEPSELAKWSLVLFISAYAAHYHDRIQSFFKGFLPCIAVLGLTCALILKEDFGTTVLIAGVCVILMLMAGCRWWHIAWLIPVAILVGYFAVAHSAYRSQRLLIFLHPQLDPKGAGYNPMQSLLSFASGGFSGLGLGNGVQKMGYLPEDSTDFIFSLIAEELGFFGCLTVVLLFLILTFCGLRIALRSRDLFGKMVAFGVTAMIGFQAAMNIAVVTVTVPTKGIALPMISSGGTGWIMTAGAIGLLMSIERTNRLGLVAGTENRSAPSVSAPPQSLSASTVRGTS
ncbi:MAG TPA: putative peptidoglycan glycosyltransferase FtsW [Phycisphaerae bacterium]|nr:putative peptidoglycan glycosyltransferase FtsW [Phycisphaerae bacterium]